jgi:hypothetical protein
VVTLEDCIALCGLTEDEVSEMAATFLGSYIPCHEHGINKVRDRIIEDIRQAQLYGDRENVLTLLHVLYHFLKAQADLPSPFPWSGQGEGLRVP